MTPAKAPVPVCDLLARTEAFAGLSSRCYRLLAADAVERAHIRGDVIFAEHAAAEGLYLLLHGSVQLTRTAAPGGLILLGEQSAPAAILTAGFLDGSANNATATALSNCSTLVLDRNKFYELCKRNPEVPLRLLSEIGAHLRRTSGYIDLISAADTRQRLARALLDLMEEAGGPEFVLPCSHGNLAVRLGTVREVVFRNLKWLQNEGILKTSGLHIAVQSAQRLAAAAGISTSANRIFEPSAVPPIPAYFVLNLSAARRPGIGK